MRHKRFGLVEYQGLTDFRPYVDRQTQKLVFDPLYPPSLYVPQHADLQISTSPDRKRVENVMDAALDLLDTPHPRFVLVLGDFGTGKTFLLHEIAHRLAESPGLPLTPIPSSVWSVSFSLDGLQIASGSDDGTIKLWDVVTGECLATLLSTPEGWVAFRPDGSYKYDGDIGGSFWHLLNLSRCEVGELDEFIPGLRIPINDPLF